MELHGHCATCLDSIGMFKREPKVKKYKMTGIESKHFFK